MIVFSAKIECIFFCFLCHIDLIQGKKMFVFVFAFVLIIELLLSSFPFSFFFDFLFLYYSPYIFIYSSLIHIRCWGPSGLLPGVVMRPVQDPSPSCSLTWAGLGLGVMLPTSHLRRHCCLIQDSQWFSISGLVRCMGWWAAALFDWLSLPSPTASLRPRMRLA